MGRPSNRTERRAQIVRGLMKVMGEKGYEGASVQEIARAAGLTSGLVHHHFESKEAILVALAHHLAEISKHRYERRLATARSPRTRLYAFIDAHLARGEDEDLDAVRCWVAVAAEAARREAVREVHRRQVEESLTVLRRLLADVLADEGRPAGRARAAAAGILAAMRGVLQLATAIPDVAPAGFAAPVVRRMADGLLAAEGGGT